MKLTLLTTCDNAISANIIRSQLNAKGVFCVLHNEHFSNLLPHYFSMLGSGVRVMVKEEDIEQSLEIIQLKEGPLTCPNCGSANIHNKNQKWTRKLKLLAIGIFLVAPIGNLLNEYDCKDCGTAFRKE